MSKSPDGKWTNMPYVIYIPTYIVFSMLNRCDFIYKEDVAARIYTLAGMLTESTYVTPTRTAAPWRVRASTWWSTGGASGEWGGLPQRAAPCQQASTAWGASRPLFVVWPRTTHKRAQTRKASSPVEMSRSVWTMYSRGNVSSRLLQFFKEPKRNCLDLYM